VDEVLRWRQKLAREGVGEDEERPMLAHRVVSYYMTAIAHRRKSDSGRDTITVDDQPTWHWRYLGSMPLV
jgi:hypothetical protein